MTEIPLSRSGKTALDVARELAYEGGRVMMDRFHGEKQITEKGWANIVTDVDFEVEDMILARLSDESAYTWIVDPVDGTRDYASGVPLFATTLAVALEGEVLLGVTYDPNRGELFRAEKGKGAFLNDVRLQASRHSSIATCVLGTDMGYNDGMAKFALKLLDALWPGMQAIRIMGSAALGLGYAASGRTDLYSHNHLAPWDIAAGIILGHETGALVTDRNGGPITLDSHNIILAPPALHADFLKLTEGLEWRERSDGY
jgi:myo-inositol-1(or 4)-monophosphatase